VNVNCGAQTVSHLISVMVRTELGIYPALAYRTIPDTYLFTQVFRIGECNHDYTAFESANICYHNNRTA